MKIIRRKRVTAQCTGCIFSTFDEDWGELKCKKLQRRIHNPNEHTTCQHYKKKADS